MQPPQHGIASVPVARNQEAATGSQVPEGRQVHAVTSVSGYFKGSIRKDRLIGYWEDLNLMQFCFYLSLSPQSLRPSLTYSRHQLRCVLGLVEREIEAKPGHTSFQFVTTGGSCLLLHNHLLEADSFVLSQPHPGKAHILRKRGLLIRTLCCVSEVDGVLSPPEYSGCKFNVELTP